MLVREENQDSNSVMAIEQVVERVEQSDNPLFWGGTSRFLQNSPADESTGCKPRTLREQSARYSTAKLIIAIGLKERVELFEVWLEIGFIILPTADSVLKDRPGHFRVAG